MVKRFGNQWYKFYSSKWLSSETRLNMTTSERSIYRDLLDHNYEQGDLPDDEKSLAGLALVSLSEFRRGWPKVGKKFIPCPDKPGRLTNRKVEEQFSETSEKANSGKAGGKKSGESRKQKSEAGASEKNEAGASLVCLPKKRSLDKEEEKEQEKEKAFSARETKTEPPDWSVEEPCKWFSDLWPGGLPEDLWRVFGEKVNTPDRLEKLQKNAPLWAQTKKYSGGFVDACSFLKSGVWLQPPKDQLLAEARASPWRSQEPHISATEEMT